MVYVDYPDYVKVIYKYCTDSVSLFCVTCSVKNLRQPTLLLPTCVVYA